MPNKQCVHGKNLGEILVNQLVSMAMYDPHTKIPERIIKADTPGQSYLCFDIAS